MTTIVPLRPGDEAPESPFVPLAEASRYRSPRATIDPDQTKSWLVRAMPVVKAHRFILGTCVVGTFLALVLQVQIPKMLGRAIDVALDGRRGSLGHYVAIIVALAVGRWILNMISRYLLQITAFRLEYDLRHIMYEHLSRLSFSFYDRVQSGQLISRANSDIRSVQMYLAFAPTILAQCAVAVVAFAEMLTINVPLAIVAMSTMPIAFIVAVKMRERLFPMSWLIQSRLAEVATVVDENINGVRVVKAFAAEERQLKLLAAASRRTEWANAEDANIRARWSPAVENMPRLGQALVLLYGGWLAVHDHASVGTIVSFNAYVLLLQPPFRLLGQLMMMGQRAKASAGRIYEVLDEQPDVFDRPGAVDLVTAKGDVHFDGVDFAYPNGTQVLRGFDLRLRPGETVALVGRTGSGKSTVARLLGRSYDVTGGAVVVDGHDVRDLTLASLRHHVGMVADEPFLFSISIRDNLAYGRPDATDEDIVAAATAAGADGFIRALPEGYDTVVGERGYTLSGGQRQRISIARTLVLNPPILVLDDATSAIDVQVEQQIHEALRGLLAERTTLIIAHRLSTISLADRVAVVEDGRVIAEGTHAQLLAGEPRYAEILAQVEEEES
ncbi:MAG: Lipid export ATP-binding/permease protein msbA [Acidimicrobiales bacterium]|nr:Lipid export ATP-binding/permease protein msbA [Acidimicrobiales bacterium]